MTPKLTSILRLCTTVVTALLLALVAQDATSSLLDEHDRTPSTFVIQALPKDGDSAEDASQELWIEAIVADGQLLRWNSVKSSGNWQVVDKKGFGLPPYLLYKGTSQPGFLTFPGKSFLAIINANRWPGIVRVERNGRETQVVDGASLKREDGAIVIEDPSAKPSLGVYLGTLALFGVLVYWFGSIRIERRHTFWLILVLVVIHVLFWANQCIGSTNDSLAYLTSFQDFHKGQSSYFPPGYPVFLGLLGGLTGQSLGRWVALTQHCMVIFAGVWIYLLLRRIIPEEPALIGGLLAGALPSSLIMPQSVMSEIPTLFTMVGALYFAVRAGETGRPSLAILAGLLTGWAGTMRVVPLPALIPSLCIVYLGAARKRLLLAGVTVVVTAGAVLLPVLWTWLGSRQPMLSNSVGLHLFNRVVNEQQLLDEEGPATRHLLALLEGKNPRGVPHWEIREQGRVRELSYTALEALFREVALEGIRKDPWGYLIYSLHLAGKEFVGDPLPATAWGNTIPSYPRLENPPLVAFTAFSLARRQSLERVHRVLWPFLCWAAIAGVFVGFLLPQRLLILALAWAPMGYLLASAFVEAYNPRYNVAIVPFVAALAMIPLGLGSQISSEPRAQRLSKFLAGMPA